MEYVSLRGAASPAFPPMEVPIALPIPAARTATGCLGCTARNRCLPAGMSETDTHWLRQITIARRRLRKGQPVFRQGERFLFLYAVRFGTFKSTMSLDDGAEQVTAFHLPGEIMGFDGTGSGRHPTTATALEDGEVCVLPYSQLTDACAEARSLRIQLMRMAGAELVRDHRLLALIAHRHPEQRVAGFLLALSQRMRERGFSPNEFLLRMTRSDIGSYLGTTLETVSRSLSALARRGFITVRRRQIQLLDVESLRSEFGPAPD